MPDIIFPSMEALDYVGKTHKTGFTNGETIVVNLYTGSITEENIEDVVDLVIIHELIHCEDLNFSEREVLNLNRIILKNMEEQS